MYPEYSYLYSQKHCSGYWRFSLLLHILRSTVENNEIEANNTTNSYAFNRNLISNARARGIIVNYRVLEQTLRNFLLVLFFFKDPFH